MEGWRGRAGPPPSHFSPPSCCTCEQPGCGIFTLLPWQQTVMSQTQGPGLPPPRGVSGGSVASDWGGPRLWGRASGPGRILAPLLRAVGARAPRLARSPPLLRTDASWSFPSWLSILVILFCFLKIPPACPRRREDVLLLFLFSKVICWPVGWHWRPSQTWPCVLQGEQQARRRLRRAGAGRELRVARVRFLNNR